VLEISREIFSIEIDSCSSGVKMRTMYGEVMRCE
jgi:hypothetical protein